MTEKFNLPGNNPEKERWDVIKRIRHQLDEIEKRLNTQEFPASMRGAVTRDKLCIRFNRQTGEIADIEYLDSNVPVNSIANRDSEKALGFLDFTITQHRQDARIEIVYELTGFRELPSMPTGLPDHFRVVKPERMNEPTLTAIENIRHALASRHL